MEPSWLVRILCLAPIQYHIRNEVPILECWTASILLIPVHRFSCSSWWNVISNGYVCFLINNIELECLSTNMKVIKYNGVFCNIYRGFGNYAIKQRMWMLLHTNVSIKFNVKKSNHTLFKTAVSDWVNFILVPYFCLQLGLMSLRKLMYVIKSKIALMQGLIILIVQMGW